MAAAIVSFELYESGFLSVYLTPNESMSVFEMRLRSLEDMI